MNHSDISWGRVLELAKLGETFDGFQEAFKSQVDGWKVRAITSSLTVTKHLRVRRYLIRTTPAMLNGPTVSTRNALPWKRHWCCWQSEPTRWCQLSKKSLRRSSVRHRNACSGECEYLMAQAISSWNHRRLILRHVTMTRGLRSRSCSFCRAEVTLWLTSSSWQRERICWLTSPRSVWAKDRVR